MRDYNRHCLSAIDSTWPSIWTDAQVFSDMQYAFQYCAMLRSKILLTAFIQHWKIILVMTKVRIASNINAAIGCDLRSSRVSGDVQSPVFPRITDTDVRHLLGRAMYAASSSSSVAQWTQAVLPDLEIRRMFGFLSWCKHAQRVDFPGFSKLHIAPSPRTMIKAPPIYRPVEIDIWVHKSSSTIVNI